MLLERIMCFPLFVEVDFLEGLFLAHVSVGGCCDWLPPAWLAYPLGILAALVLVANYLFILFGPLPLIWLIETLFLCGYNNNHHEVGEQEKQWFTSFGQAHTNQRLCSRSIHEYVSTELERISSELSQRAGQPFHFAHEMVRRKAQHFNSFCPRKLGNLVI